MAKVSVIIPIYNVNEYFTKCIESVKNQTFADIEIICVNDGSTDNTQQILEEYAKNDNRIKIINKTNGGVSSARNSGLDIATGEYCYFIDADDWIELNTIEKLYNIITSNRVDVVIFGVRNIVNDEKMDKLAAICQNWLDKCKLPSGIYDIPKEISKNFACMVWNKLYKMEIINKYSCRFPVGLEYEDVYFLWAYFLHCSNYYYLNETLYSYNRHLNSITGQINSSRRDLDFFDIETLIYKLVEKYKNIDDYKQCLIDDFKNNVKYIFSILPEQNKKEAVIKIYDYYKNVNHDKAILKLYNEYKYLKIFRFIKKIFSFTKMNDTHRVLTILGIKIKFRRHK